MIAGNPIFIIQISTEKERERVKERRWRQGSLNEKVIVKIERGKEEEHFNYLWCFFVKLCIIDVRGTLSLFCMTTVTKRGFRNR